MDAQATSDRTRRLRMVSEAALERLRAELPPVLEVPLCRHGHGPLNGWRARGRRRGRYCRACNAAAFRRWYDAHRRTGH